MLPILMRRAAVALAAAATFPVVLSAGGHAVAATTTPLNSVAAAPVAAPNGAAGTDTTITMTYGGLQRTYTLFMPTNLPTGPRPLMVVLHPLGGNPGQMETVTGFDAGAAANGVLVAYPQGVGNSWNGGACCATARDQGVDDVGFLNAILDDVEARYSVNTAHVAMGGFSNGGVMSYRYACSDSARVQSFFIGSGDALAPSCVVAGRLAFLHVHGLADTVLPWVGSRISPYTLNGILPPVISATSGVAKLDGCSGWSTSAVNALVTRYSATGCPAGASFNTYLSTTMAHAWYSNGAGVTTTGVNETGLTWSFVLGRWATT